MNSVGDWFYIDEKTLKYVGIIELEQQTDEGIYPHFEIYKNNQFIVFGSHCNVGLLQSGNFKIDQDFSFDENLNELIEDLNSYYFDGAGYQSDAFACNERM